MMRKILATISVLLILCTMLAFNTHAEDGNISITVEYADTGVEAGDTAVFFMYIYNGHSVEEEVILTVAGISEGWLAELSEDVITVPSKTTATAYLNVTSSQDMDIGESVSVTVEVSTNRLNYVEDQQGFTAVVTASGTLTCRWQNVIQYTTGVDGDWNVPDLVGRTGQEVTCLLPVGDGRTVVAEVWGLAGTFPVGFEVVNTDQTPYTDFWDISTDVSSVSLASIADIQSFTITMTAKADIDIGHYISVRAFVDDNEVPSVRQKTDLKKWVATGWANYTVDVAMYDSDPTDKVGEIGQDVTYNFTVTTTSDASEIMSMVMFFTTSDSIFADWEMRLYESDTPIADHTALSPVWIKAEGDNSPMPHTYAQSPNSVKYFTLAVKASVPAILTATVWVRFTLREFDFLDFIQDSPDPGGFSITGLIVYGLIGFIAVMLVVAVMYTVRGKSKKEGKK